MPRKSDGEKIDELEKLVATLTERLDTLTREVDETSDHPTRISLLELQVAEMKTGQEKWGQRLWMLLAPLAGAVVGSLLTYALKK